MAARIYDTTRWRKLRAKKLKANPLCEVCERQGKLTPARAVDHRIAINAGGPAFPPLDGLASLCLSHHSIKTSAEDRPDRRPGRGLMRGCDVNGMPLDPNHEWNAPGGPNFSDAASEDFTDGANATAVSSKARRWD